MYNSEHSQNVLNPALKKHTNRKDSEADDNNGSRTSLFGRQYKKKGETGEIEGEDFDDEMNEKVEASTVDRSMRKQNIHSATSLDAPNEPIRKISSFINIHPITNSFKGGSSFINRPSKNVITICFLLNNFGF